MSLDKLLYLRGVGLEYTDYHGERVVIPERDRQALLACMLDQPLTPELNAKQNYHIDATPWLLPLASFQWCYADDLNIQLCLPAQFTGDLELRLETEWKGFHSLSLSFPQVLCDNVIASGESLANQIKVSCIGDYYIDGMSFFKYQISLPSSNTSDFFKALKPGYHRLILDYKGASKTGFKAVSLGVDKTHSLYQPYRQSHYLGALMVAPTESYQGLDSKKQWGVSVQLYSLASPEQWGIGDFGQLRELIELLSPLGACFIQLNPLHAQHHHRIGHESPYSPSDRRRINPIYIDIAALSEYQYVSSELELPQWQLARTQLNELEWLDYSSVYRLKFAALALSYEAFCRHELSLDTPRARQFQVYVQQQGNRLLGYALFEAKAGLKVRGDTTELISLGEKAVESYRQVIAKQEFYLYLAFVSEQQLEQCQKLAKESGMAIGIIRDLAVGAQSDGYEVEENAELFCTRASIGAPPDDFTAQGQDWGLPPLDPVAVKENDFTHFIQLVRSNLQSCGGLRIDHVMGLYRLWWWIQQDPISKVAQAESSNTKIGGYIYYPLETLMAILALESHRAKSILIGEDLGLVPEPVKYQLDKLGIISNELFYFSRHDDCFYQPHEFKPHSLLMLANHDVPPLAAWWSGKDISTAQKIGLLTTQDEVEQALNLRARHKQELLALLIELRVLDRMDLQAGSVEQAGPDFALLMEELTLDKVVQAWIKGLARANSSLLAIQLSDLALETQAVNIPGTWKEYPNWRRRISLTSAEILNQQWVKKLMGDLRQVRGAI